MTAPPRTHQGWTVEASEHDDPTLRQAIDHALDYRGDVTFTCRDGRVVSGYVFDRQCSGAASGWRVRLLPADGSPRVTLRYADIARISFTGRDTASGKSFETWMRKYVEKKLSGERAAIESESIDSPAE